MSDIASPTFGAIMGVLGLLYGAYRQSKHKEARQWFIVSVVIIGATAIIYLNPGHFFNNSNEALTTLVATAIGCFLVAVVVGNKSKGKR